MFVTGHRALARSRHERKDPTRPAIPSDASYGRKPQVPRRRSAASSLRDETAGVVGVVDNLGQLGRFAAQGQPTSDDAALMLQRVDPSSFNEQGLYMDGGSIFASSVLLLVLLAFSTNRIFGLDRFVVSAARSWREKKRNEDLTKIQRMMGNDGESNVQDPSNGSPPGGAA
ncbi:hypothetical protein PLESTF_000043100 [Pleodorina starrii]|nr:hypothetical protein PLESTF_000043100 [Pleodorina starrii]